MEVEGAGELQEGVGSVAGVGRLWEGAGGTGFLAYPDHHRLEDPDSHCNSKGGAGMCRKGRALTSASAAVTGRPALR